MISKNYISMLLLLIAVITFIKTTPFVVEYITLCTAALVQRVTQLQHPSMSTNEC